MSCHKFTTSNGDTGYMCMTNTYRFGGYLFEDHSHLGPYLLKKNGEARQRLPCERSKFWDAYGAFCKLTDDEKDGYRA